jgi:hypothetical protein
MKRVRLGVLFILTTIIAVLVLKINNGFLFDKIFFVTAQINESTPKFLILYPIAQNNGTIQFKNAFDAGSSEFGNVVLTPEQVMNFYTIGSINESLYDFNGRGKGSLLINNNNGTRIKMHLFSIGRFYYDYTGYYELKENKIKLLNANFNYLPIHRVIIFFSPLIVLFFLGFVFVISGTLKYLWFNGKAIAP